MRRTASIRRRWSCLAAAGALALTGLAGCTEPPASSEPGAAIGAAGVAPPNNAGDRILPVDRERASPGVVAAGAADAPYNYAPATLLEDGKQRMWWCSQYGAAQPPGDDVLYGESTAPDGPVTAPGGGPPIAVLSGSEAGFDGMHTCDPSVVKVDGVYYMYFTGAAGDHALGNAIGLAYSRDGISWQRAADGKPVVNPAHDVHRDNSYGVGQPSVVHLDGWFYLMFTDTTGAAAGWNGAGQFIVRAKDPNFAHGVEALGPKGFVPVPNTETARTNSLVEAFSADLMWVAQLDAFAIAHETPDGTTVTFWNRDFTANPYQPVVLRGPWREGPGFLRQAEGHAPVSPDDPCGRVPLDVVRATSIGSAGAPTGLRRFGLDVHGLRACADPARALAVLDGVAMPSPERTMDLISGGRMIRVDRRSVAVELASQVLDRRPAGFAERPPDVRLPAETPAVHAPAHGMGLVLDGALWPVHPDRVAELNGSRPDEVTDPVWASYPAGSTLGR